MHNSHNFPYSFVRYSFYSGPSGQSPSKVHFSYPQHSCYSVFQRPSIRTVGCNTFYNIVVYSFLIFLCVVLIPKNTVYQGDFLPRLFLSLNAAPNIPSLKTLTPKYVSPFFSIKSYCCHPMHMNSLYLFLIPTSCALR